MNGSNATRLLGAKLRISWDIARDFALFVVSF
jgi:hypothetical protein